MICPIGTIQNLIGGKKYDVICTNSDKCKKCLRCEKECPMHIKIVSDNNKGMRDCIRCGKCVYSCPIKILEIRKR
jgi:polyferredoxin